MFLVIFLSEHRSNNNNCQQVSAGAAHSHSHPLKHRLQSEANPLTVRRRCLRFRSVVVKAAAASGRGRRVYSQSQPPLINAPVKQVASFIIPAGVFVAVTFGMQIFFFLFFFKKKDSLPPTHDSVGL